MTDVSLIPLISRWWTALALGATLGALAGVGISQIVPKTYTATATLIVGPINTDADLEASGSLAATYENVVTSRKVLGAALQSVGRTTLPEQFAKSVKVTSNTVTRILTVSVDDQDAAVAAQLANAISKESIAVVSDGVAAPEGQIRSFAEEEEIAALSGKDRRGVLTAIRRVFGASPAGRLTVVNDAVAPTDPSSPGPPLLGALGLLLGLLTAFVVVLAVDGRSGAAHRRASGDGAV